MINLINNLSENHQNKVVELSCNAKEIIFVSPFIFDNFAILFEQLNLELLQNIQLITTLQPKGDDQLKKPNALFSFIENSKRIAPSADCRIHINNRLHGKIYIFHYESKVSQALITSANLTKSGLSNNHEWGVLIDEQELISKLQKEVIETIEYADVPHELIVGKMRLYADQAMRNFPKASESPDINAHLIRLLKDYAVAKNESRSLSLKDARGIFLKPIGETERPVLIENEERFGELSKLHFPNPKPKQVKPKDILISFGTGSRSVLCIHTALTGVEEIPKDLQAIDENAKRWPWFVNAYNHTPHFADIWWKYDITIDQLSKEYLEQNPDAAISNAGGKTFGSFNYGAGHLAISQGFADFVCHKILSIEDELANV
jgi:HKD family nuclease